MESGPDVRVERLTRYIFSAPSWPRSLAIIVVLGLIIDVAAYRPGTGYFLVGTLGFSVPALVAFLLTVPLVRVFDRQITWNRSALLALACTVLTVILSLSPALVFGRSLFPALYAIALGLVLGLRLLVLAAVADYRLSRMALPAFTQSAAAIAVGAWFFTPDFVPYALLLQVVFGLVFVFLIWLIERPLKRAFQISGLNFLNTFIAHLTDGSKKMEDFFREIGEEVYVPEVSLFFSRDTGKDVLLTVPNVHPGPMGDVGGGNLPRILHDTFPEETLVAHGCATHDFNLVSESEIQKIARAVEASREGLVFSAVASRPVRVASGSVSILCQRFGDALLMVSTRSPERTEDLDYSIGMAIMAEGRCAFSEVAFVDAHNCMTSVGSPVLPATRIATEYIAAAREGFRAARDLPLAPLAIGVSHVRVPFTREQGFGSLGVQALVTEVEGKRTAYVLIDGNNVALGVREHLRAVALAHADEAEIMTTDTHTVNTISGKNPVGYAVPAEEIVPYIEQAVREAIADLAPARVGSATASCEGIVVFGSQRVSQLASTVNAMLAFIAPLSFMILVLAFLLSVVAYIMLQ
ncbi:MAG: putative rane protein [Euryarchaeota archaeon]|jgi:putative membrane protein|nr:putative rane protein [Euryarchaeota archaeon]MDN5340788.1 putative rane protein [Euryarchaeota archaeon]